MKHFNIILFTIALCLSSNLFSQSLEIVGEKNIDITADLNEFTDIYFTTAIKNIGPAPVNVKVKTQVIKITPGHSYDICWDGLCSPPTIDNWTSSSSYKLDPSQTTPSALFYAHYYSYYKFTDPSEGEGNIVYIFFNEMNPDDKVEIDAKYKFIKGQKIFEFFSNPDVKVSIDGKELQISSEKSDKINLELFDIKGNLAMSQTFLGDYLTNLNYLSSGTYIVRLTSNGKLLSIGKVILN